MKHFFIASFVVMVVLLSFRSTTFSQSTSPLIIDHTCEELSQIPMDWIDSAQANQKWHYAHTSHGGQLTSGLTRIENNDTAYNIAIGYSTLPTVSAALCIFDGQEGDTYITPEEYWRTAAGMNSTRSVLNNNPELTLSQWSWCTQVNYYSQSQVQAYLDSIMVLEAEFPNVTFIYMTGNAQTGPGNHYNTSLSQEP